jgi:type II secretory pathway pseudopilin PulG
MNAMPRLNIVQAKRRREAMRGFTLIELLVLLVILAGFALVAEQAVSFTLKASRAAQKEGSLAARMDNVTDVLRRDIWSATSLRAADGALHIGQAGGSTIDWTYRDGRLVRSGSGTSRSWDDLPAIRFEAREAVATLTLAPSADPSAATRPAARRAATRPGGEEQVTFVSAFLLAGGGR